MDILGDLNFVLSVVIGLLILTVLVVIHELGHALVAKRNGVVVEEFGLGFPPKAKTWRLKQSWLGKNVKYSLNWLPLGGFVKMQGEHDADTKKGDYGAASFWVKTKILLAGVLINWVAAMVMFMVLAWFGLPKILPNQFSIASDTRVSSSPVTIVQVVDGSPAAKAGLKTGDEIVKFDHQPLGSSTKLSDETKDDAGQAVQLTYKRDGQTHTVKTTLNQKDVDNQGYLGVATAERQFIHATWSAPIVGVGTTVQLTGFTFSALGNMVKNLAVGTYEKAQIGNQAAQTQGGQKLATVSDSVAGPVGILGVIFPAAEQAGIVTLTMLTAIISMTLAIMNVLPIPGLDGGRWFLMAVFRLIKKPLTSAVEEKVVATGMMVLFGLIILITIADIGKLGA